MKGLKIVEYNESYAKSIADMWRRSTEGWNGENGNKTEESIISEHKNSANINTYLAILNNEVVGYCSFTKSLEDEDTLHIKLLNARYDCHGMGIGKALVKKAIERTIELKYPRIDINTWASNTKAMPLYKKCGYFFENREDEIHLMNFIPTVMQTEAVNEFFKTANWYDDMKRTIDMEPDGGFIDGFEIYEYCWGKNNQKLRMDFERKGRGLRLIETEDYKITLSAPKQNLIFNRTYNVAYEIINKSGKALTVEVIGKNNKNIKFLFHEKIDVLKKEIIQGDFYVEEIQKEFNNFSIYPKLTADVLINGKKAVFSLGISPQFPAKVSLFYDNVLRCNDEKFNLYIDIENCTNENSVFEFVLPQVDELEFSQNNFKIEMVANEKRQIPIEVIMRKPCLYHEELNIKATLENGECIKFKKYIGEVFQGYDNSFGGELDNKYVIVNDIYKLIMDKSSNKVHIFVGNKKMNSYILYPRIGMPYSDEFSNTSIENVKLYNKDSKMILIGDYISTVHKDVIVKTIFKLYKNGLIEHYYKVQNKSNEPTKNISIEKSFHYRIEGAIIPYDNKIIKSNEVRDDYPSYYNSEKFSENWIFSSLEESLIWPQNSKCTFDGWHMNIEYDLGILKGNEIKTTKPLYLAFSTFKTWEEVKKFALKCNHIKNTFVLDDFELNINDYNPFVKENFNIKIIENKEILHEGEVTIQSSNNSFNETHVQIENKTQRMTIPLHADNFIDNDILSIKANFKTFSFEGKKAIFYIKNIPFKHDISEISGIKVYSIDNGVIKIKASNMFSPGIFSMEFEGKEWLDTDFPNREMKSWYNPWIGGILNIPENMIENGKILLNEDINIEFIEKLDTLGNRWSGIKTSIHIKNIESFKEIYLNQYFLMLPGVPIVLNFTQIINNEDIYRNINKFTNVSFLKIGNELEKSWVSVKNHGGYINKYRPGTRDYEIYPKSSFLCGSDDLNYKIQVYSDTDEYEKYIYLCNSELTCMHYKDIKLLPHENKILPNVFYIFTKNHIEDKYLKDLQNIKFE